MCGGGGEGVIFRNNNHHLEVRQMPFPVSILSLCEVHVVFRLSTQWSMNNKVLTL